VSAHCTDKLVVTRSPAWTKCDACTDTITFSVSTLVAADPTATTTSIHEAGDSAEVTAAKTLCEENDQQQWDKNLAACVNKCLDPNKPWYNSAA